jgi:hypothetical protein
MNALNLAPIVLFVYNRPNHTEQTLNALKNNYLFSESKLFIYADGKKENATVEDVNSINEVRKIIKSKKWTENLEIVESETNKGLANSIITGVSEIVNKYEKVIVLEDDIITSKFFLKYMNDALNVYANNEKVMHITGYMYPHKNNILEDTFFYPMPNPWGWATWSRAWKYYNNDSVYLYNYINQHNLWKRFNSAGGDYLQSQLERNISGELNTWFVKWHAVNIIRSGLTLFPGKSLVRNVGFDGTGEHCGTSINYETSLAEKIIVKKKRVVTSRIAKKIIFEFHYDKIKNTIKVKRFLKRILKLNNFTKNNF